MKKKTIRVCDDCGTPLIWTFAFDYCERYCLNCGLKGGMMGTGKDVPATRELIFEQKLANSIWDQIYSLKGFFPSGARKIKCKKCDEGERHIEHMTKAEKEWLRSSFDLLRKSQGIIW